MPFLDIARAIYAYTAASADELNIEDNDLLYVLEKGEDDWWKVKKKITGDDDGPVGLVPQNYLEQVRRHVRKKRLTVDPSNINISDVIRLHCPDRRRVVLCR
jgi:actin cytoskeleton-regulatory complex protein SLA1